MPTSPDIIIVITTSCSMWLERGTHPNIDRCRAWTCSSLETQASAAFCLPDDCDSTRIKSLERHKRHQADEKDNRMWSFLGAWTQKDVILYVCRIGASNTYINDLVSLCWTHAGHMIDSQLTQAQTMPVSTRSTTS